MCIYTYTENFLFFYVHVECIHVWVHVSVGEHLQGSDLCSLLYFFGDKVCITESGAVSFQLDWLAVKRHHLSLSQTSALRVSVHGHTWFSNVMFA